MASLNVISIFFNKTRYKFNLVCLLFELFLFEQLGRQMFKCFFWDFFCDVWFADVWVSFIVWQTIWWSLGNPSKWAHFVDGYWAMNEFPLHPFCQTVKSVIDVSQCPLFDNPKPLIRLSNLLFFSHFKMTNFLLLKKFFNNYLQCYCLIPWIVSF